MKNYKTPKNVVRLISGVMEAAAGTAFYKPILDGLVSVVSLEDFEAAPVTPLARFREQRLTDVLPAPSRLQWIVGPYRGHNRRSVAVAEGVDETGARYDVFKDALRVVDPGSKLRSCAVVTAPARRYFAAEISTILGYVGVQAHVFMDHDRGRTYERLSQVRPEVLVILCDDMDESSLPDGLELCITFRRSQRFTGRRQLDLYHIDEFGFLGHSTDLERWILYNDQYLYERSERKRLIVTALHNRTQPLIRLETEDQIDDLGEHDMVLGRLSDAG